MKQADPETIRRLQLGNIKCLLRHRYGPTLPDDDAGREDLFELLSSVSLRAKASAKVMRNVIQTWAPWMTEAEVMETIQRIDLTPPRLRYRTAEDLGKKFNVTHLERVRLRLWLIAPIDVSQAELEHWRHTRRRQTDKVRKERKRREAGVRTRQAYLATSVSRQKPWEAEGISRATWYRRRETSASANKLLIGSRRTCLKPEGRPRGARPETKPEHYDSAVWTDTGAAP
jgi:hypothetical protein